MKPYFQIVRYWTNYCPSTDAITGSSARRLPMAYLTEAYAMKLAARLANLDPQDEDDYRVIPYGGDVWRQAVTRPCPDIAVDDPGPYGDFIPF